MLDAPLTGTPWNANRAPIWSEPAPLIIPQLKPLLIRYGGKQWLYL
jgi:hypothetical protein